MGSCSSALPRTLPSTATYLPRSTRGTGCSNGAKTARPCRTCRCCFAGTALGAASPRAKDRRDARCANRSRRACSSATRPPPSWAPPRAAASNISPGPGKTREARPGGRGGGWWRRAWPRGAWGLRRRPALHEATEWRRTAVRDTVELEGGDKGEFVRITVDPLHDDDNESLSLVVFSDLRAPAAPRSLRPNS